MDQTTISETLKKIKELETERNIALLTFREIQEKIAEIQKFLIYGGYYEGAGTAVFMCEDLYKIKHTKNVILYLETIRRHNIAPVDIYMFLKDKKIDYLPPDEKHVCGGWYRLEETDLAEISSLESDIFNQYIEETKCFLDADTLVLGNHTKDDKTKIVVSIIEELSDRYSGYAPIGEVHEYSKVKLNLNDEKINQIIDRLRRDGEIFMPKPDFVAVAYHIDEKPRINIGKKKTKEILSIIKRSSEENSGPAPLEDVIERAIKECGIKLEDMRTILYWLRRDGEIFEPRKGYLKIP